MLEPETRRRVGPSGSAVAADAVLIARLDREEDGTPAGAVIEYANRAWRDGLCLGDDEVIGRPLLEVVPAFADRIPVLARAIDTGEAVEMDGPAPQAGDRRFRVRVTPDGERACVVVHPLDHEAPVADGAGGPIDARPGTDTGTGEDVPPAPDGPDVRYRAILESLPEAVAIRDTEGRVVEINERAREMLAMPPGMPLAEVERLFFARMTAPDGSAVTREEGPGITALRSGSEAAREVAVTAPDGRELWVQGAARPVHNEDGSIAGSVVVFRDVTAEHEALAALERQSRLIDLSHDAIIVRAMDGTIRSWNAGAAALYGWSAAVAVGRLSHELLATSFPAPLAEIDATVATTGAWEGRLHHLARDGREIIVDSRWVAIHDGGPMTTVMEVNRDITGLVETSEALASSEAELARAQRLGSLGSWRLDVASGDGWWSEQMFRIFGFDPGEPIPDRDRLAEFVGAPTAARLGGLVARLLATGEPYVTDLDVTRRDGSVIHVRAAGEAVRDAAGAIVAVRGAVVDVTALHEAKRASEDTAADLAAAQRLAHVGSWRWDPPADTFAWSDELFRIVGLDPAGPTPTRTEMTAIFGPGAVERFDAALARTITDGQTREAELDVTRPDGTRRRVLSRAVVVPYPGGGFAVRGSVADITERQAAELLLRRFNEELEEQVAERTARLEAANEELRTFSHSISHDLRGPVRAIASFAGLLVRSVGETLGETDRHRLDNILVSGLTMGRLIDDLAAYTRVGQGAVQSVPVPLESVVTALRTLLAARIAESGGEIRLVGDATPLADPSLLERVLLNLLDNAMAYSRPGVPPVVEIDAVREEGRVALRVRDNGVGIPAENQGRIFDLFTRTRPDQQLEHSGVGLAVARKAARAMGSDLALESEVGVGSTFTMYLPAA